MKRTFEITEDHLKLAKKMYVSWDNCEFGAPAIDCKRPYGNSYVEGDIAEILGISDNKRHDDDEPYFTDKDLEYMNKVHKEMQTVIQIALSTGEFSVGNYHMTEDYDNTSWKRS
jgi:hypothetical protein